MKKMKYKDPQASIRPQWFLISNMNFKTNRRIIFVIERLERTTNEIWIGNKGIVSGNCEFERWNQLSIEPFHQQYTNLSFENTEQKQWHKRKQ